MKWNSREAADITGSLGAALLVAGYLRYSIQGELLTSSKVILITGAVLTLASVGFGFRRILNFFAKRSSQLGTNTAVLSIAVLAILGILNFVGYQHHKRFDLTTEKLYTLSDQTRTVLGNLKSDVTVVHFDKTANSALDDLMTEYKNLSPHVKYENVDPQAKPEVAKEFGVTRMGDVIVSSGAHKEPLEPSSDSGYAEEDVTSAIMKVTRDKLKTVCFVTGHGERSSTDDQSRGYSNVGQGLAREGYITKSVNLVSENDVPPDCDVLVIAGPTQPFFPQETAMVAKYLAGGGKVLAEVDPETDPKLDSIFQAWNINVGNNIVIDASGVGQLLGTGPAIPLVTDFGDSPITKSFQGSMAFFPLARTVSIVDKTKADPSETELLKTSARSFTTPKIEQKIEYDAKTDTLGPLSLGVAESRAVGDKSARLVVIGDSDFASNAAATQQRNGDLFYNTIDWLAQDESLISIRPKSATNRHVILTEAQSAALQWVDLFFLPGIVIISGISIWWKRR